MGVDEFSASSVSLKDLREPEFSRLSALWDESILKCGSGISPSKFAVVGIPTWLYFIIKACSCVALSRADDDVAR
jgi:hypothetical protein